MNLIKEDIKSENIDDKKEENIEDKKSENNKNEKIEKKSVKSDEKKSEKKSMESIKNLTEKSKELKNDSIPTDLIPEDDFSKYIFEQINLIRTNPKSFIPIIEKAKKNVTKDIHNRILYKTKVKVALSKGIPSFEETISYLNQIQPMNKLIFNPIICIPLPKNEEELNDKTYFRSQINEMKNNGIKIDVFFKDLIKDGEISALLMIVDDSPKNSGIKRECILNPNYKYIGISNIKIGKQFVAYITFSKE